MPVATAFSVPASFGTAEHIAQLAVPTIRALALKSTCTFDTKPRDATGTLRRGQIIVLGAIESKPGGVAKATAIWHTPTVGIARIRERHRAIRAIRLVA
jgi:hypothetical protein